MEELYKDLAKVPSIRVLIPLIAGIILGGSYASSWATLSILLLLLVAFCLVLLVHLLGPGPFRFAWNVLCFFLFILAGVAFRVGENREQLDMDLDGEMLISGFISSEIREKDSVLSFQLRSDIFASVSQVKSVGQKVLIYARIDSMENMLISGDYYIFRGYLSPIENTGNPGEFDYKTYMSRRSCHYRLFTSSSQAQKVLSKRKSKQYLPLKIQIRLKELLWRNDISSPILLALTTGNKTMLDPLVKEEFSDAGAMHLLAVSGLHVGMIWWVLDLLILLPRRQKYIKFLRIFIILSILWFYAAITGFSESVTRSVCMFSLLSVSKEIQRASSIYNTLLISALILILLKPLRIYEAGFQLSYLAVFGIVSLQPKFACFFQVKGKIIKYISDLITVSIAAQLSTLPLSLFYFHKFSTVFLFTNLLAIPIVSIILIGFVLSAPVLLLFPGLDFPVDLLNSLASLLNTVIHQLSSFHFASLDNIPLDKRGLLLLLFTLFAFIALLNYKKFVYLLIILSSLGAFLFFTTFQSLHSGSEKSITVYSFNKVSAFTIRKGYYMSTYYLCDTLPAPFVINYLESLPAQFYGIKSHVLINLQHSKTDYLENDRGIYIVSEDPKVLFLESRDLKKVQCCIHREKWDYVIYRSDAYMAGSIEIDSTLTKRIGDATLKSWQRKYIRGLDEYNYFIGEEGVFIDQYH